MLKSKKYIILGNDRSTIFTNSKTSNDNKKLRKLQTIFLNKILIFLVTVKWNGTC